jgi:hypothetical protein
MSLKAASFSTVSLDVYHVISIGTLQAITCDLYMHSAYPCRIALFCLSCSQGQSQDSDMVCVWGGGGGRDQYTYKELKITIQHR